MLNGLLLDWSATDVRKKLNYYGLLMWVKNRYYQQRINNEFWLAERNSMKMPESCGCGIGDKKELVGDQMQRGKDSQLKTRYGNVKTAENCGPHFRVSSKNRSHTRRKPVETKPANKHVKTKIENQKENERSTSSLFLLPTFYFSLSSKRGRLSFHTLFLSPWRRIEVANKVLY